MAAMSRIRLLKPGFESTTNRSWRDRLQLLPIEFGAIRQRLITSGAAALVHEVTSPRGAGYDPSMIAAVMISMFSSVAFSATGVSTRVATSMSAGVPSTASEDSRRSEDKKYADY